MWRCLIWVVVGVACTKKNPDYCASDAECTDPAAPFCDINGEYAESGHEANRCSVTPASCPIERCGCMPGAAISCDVDQLTTCNADGHSTTTSTCAMGCATDPRCLTFEPSNGLGPSLDESASEADVTLPGGTTIDTDLGLARDQSGNPITVHSEVVVHDGSMIRVFTASSFVIGDAVASGSAALAFVASGEISIVGVLDVGAHGVHAGPGAQDSTLCNGASTKLQSSVGNPYSFGAGGAGNATPGAAGGGFEVAGGVGGPALVSFDPLVGGCRGGNLLDQSGAVVTGGGAGGGAVQIVSGAAIRVSEHGFITSGGGGGGDSSGGGSGGIVVLEAPAVTLDGTVAGLATNGGSGCGSGSGVDGGPTGSPAHSVSCSGASTQGDGGTGSTLPQAGYLCVSNPPTSYCELAGYAQSGGGAGGRTRIATRTGGYMPVSNPVTSTAITTDTLVPK